MSRSVVAAWLLVIAAAFATIGGRSGHAGLDPEADTAAESMTSPTKPAPESTPTSEQSAEDWIELANQEYQLGLDTADRGARLDRFRRARRLYARAIDTATQQDRPVSADLWTNVGNAALQARQLGEAVLAFRHALRIDPDHERARKNLRETRAALPPLVRPAENDGVVDTFFFWHQALSPAERFNGAALAFAIAAILLAISIRTGRGSLRNLAALPAIVWVALLVSVFLDRDPTDDAVLTAPETIGRSADSHNVAPRFSEPLPAGTEVTILERRTPWVHVELASGRDAWVPETALTPLTAAPDA